MNSLENEVKPYKRETLLKIKQTDSDLINFAQSKILEKKFGFERLNNFLFCNLSHLYFYHYSCESVNDNGWGCAWRSLQSALRFQLSLSNQSKDNDISFYSIFMKYGSKQSLMEIYKNMNKKEKRDEILNLLSNKVFAPFENQNGWAEPFISQLVLYDFGFEGDLILVNGYPKNSYAPKEVFDKIVNFKEFKDILKFHFNKDNPAPIILDDSWSSIAIIGIKYNEEDENIEIMIMDPHTSTKPEIGLYIITLDEKGEFQKIEPEELVLASSAIYFSGNKPWMVYIPKTN